MSQAGLINSTSAPPPPSVATSYVEDTGVAVPALNILNVLGTNGISTSGAGNTITISFIDNFLSGTATTIDGVTYVSFTSSANIPLPTPSTSVNIRANISGMDVGSGLAAGGELIGLAKNIAGVVTIVGIPDLTKNNDIALADWTADMSVSGTNVQVQVRGVAGETIQWKTIIDYVIAP